DFWTCAKTTSSGVREFFQKYFDAEQRAAFLRMWGLLLIPGPLQTREYAEAIFRKGGLDDEEISEQTDLRMQRRAKVDGPEPAQVTALIYERALYYKVGASTTMVDQLKELLMLSRRRNVVLQVVRDDGYFPGTVGPFGIASGPGISDIVDMVTVLDSVTDEPGPVGTVAAQFEVIHGYACSVAESQTLMTEAIEWWSQQK
ncbi:MAG TPA: DUF5753 domain-containing protein, partial [Trebonia sp.]|nr:DUF5753 domain-containing protein [Trebonia sp.]